MKKLLISCILIVSLVFISGCTGEEKANAQTSTESPSSEHVINPTTILKGYQSSGYRTFATNEMNSVIYDFSYYYSLDLERHGKLYEGPLPSDQKCTGTYFTLFNEENGIQMMINIWESDSDSKFEDSFNDSLNGHGSNSVKENYDQIETNLVGDYSFLGSVSSDEDGDERTLNGLTFAHENYIVSIYAFGTNENIDLYRIEILKVAKKINSQLD